jgi:hypothetical protein
MNQQPIEKTSAFSAGESNPNRQHGVANLRRRVASEAEIQGNPPAFHPWQRFGESKKLPIF